LGAADEKPEGDCLGNNRFEWFVAGGEIGGVRSGCHTGFGPQLVDFDSDGRTDILSGSGMPGEVFFFRRQEDGTFAQGRPVEYEKDEPNRCSVSVRAS